MAKCTIDAGICGFVTVVETETTEDGMIRLKMTTDCPNLQKVAEELGEIDPYDEIFKRAISTRTFEITSKHSPHPCCVVPSGILKAIEVEAGLALPKDVKIEIER